MIFVFLVLLSMQVQAADWGALFNTLQQSLEKPKPSAPAQENTESAPTSKEAAAVNLLGSLLASQKGTPLEEERMLGDQITGNLLGAVSLVRDDRLQRYVNQVGRWVALQSERPDLTWNFGVIDSEDINAFAAPGGFILITRGLYARLHNEAELAGVLGHEIGHVMKKHHLKVLQKSRQLSALSGLASQAVAGKSKSPQQRQLLQNVIGNGAEILARGLDKDAEFEADRIGMVLAARAGYDAFGLPAVLQEIGHLSDQDSRTALLFKTHPHPDTRFEKLADAVGTRLDHLEPGKTLEKGFYRLP